MNTDESGCLAVVVQCTCVYNGGNKLSAVAINCYEAECQNYCTFLELFSALYVTITLQRCEELCDVFLYPLLVFGKPFC